jgi:hypothetical protein
VSHRAVEPGIVQVLYEHEDDLKPDRQRELLADLEKEIAKGPLAVVFVVTKVAWIDVSVPKFWLGVTSAMAPGFAAMAIVSSSLAVRAAAKGFGMSVTLRRLPLAVATFTDVDGALGWARAARLAT